MAEVIGTASNGTASFVTKEYPVANGVTVTAGDMVYLSSGRVTSASIAGVTLLGMVEGGQSNNLGATVATDATATTAFTVTGDSGGTKKVLVVVDPSAKFLLTNDNVGTTFAASHVGTCFDLTGATGAQLVDTSTTGTTGQLECVEYGYKGDNTKGVFIINEHKYKVNA